MAGWERKENEILTTEEQVEEESLGGKRKTNMPFGEFGDKRPSKGGSTHALLSY